MNVILLVASCQTGSKPNTYGDPEYIFGSRFNDLGSGFKYNEEISSKVKFFLKRIKICFNKR